MRLTCPCCGPRDAREFTYRGAALYERPDGDWSEDWHAYIHLRDNPAGEHVELWYHGPCGAWVEVTRNTATHEVLGSRLAREGAAT